MNNIQEMGGYLPLELFPGMEYHSQYEKYTVYSCSGRSALYAALSIERPTCIYLPYYICDTVEEPIYDLSIPLKRYRLTTDFLPDISDIPEGSCILLVNYFGMNYRKIESLLSLNYRFIIDQTQGFFTPPVIQENIYNIYSCRKFAGVADGGYLIAKNCENTDFVLSPSTSSSHAAFLFDSFEGGTNCAYGKNLANEERLHHCYQSMSPLTKGILCSANYDYIKNRRIENWKFLHENLDAYNRLSLPDSVPGYMYPFFYTHDIHKELIAAKIYVPRLWKEALIPELEGSFEYQLSQSLIPLPIDQRYDISHMKYLINVIKQYLK